MEQTEYFGFGSINNLERILKEEKLKKNFLVAGKKSFELSGAKKLMENIFQDYEVKRFEDFSSNPQLKDIKQAEKIFKLKNYDGIIGVGGGSSIDVAKTIKLFYFEKYNKSIPLIAIPTTAGSGSEATHHIVYYDGKEKQSKGNPKITLPNYSICDPQLIMSLPKEIAASTGMDALSQAVESYWSVNSTLLSKEFARESIGLLIKNLEKMVNNPDKESRSDVMKAANLAGKAINITKTTACHSISYPITSYFKIPHGHAVGLTLGEILVFNAKVNKQNCRDKRGPEYVKKIINELTDLIGGGSTNESKHIIQNLMQKIGLETKLSHLGLKKEDASLIIKKGFKPERIKNNPRLLSKENLKKILENIM